jgi:protein-tyrosine phosphatase
MKVLVVCLGNICRSPIAEGLLQKKADDAGLNWQVESAGTNGFHNGEPPHRLSQKVAESNGVEIGHQRSRKLKKEDFVNFDRIYAMADDVFSEIKEIGGTHYDAHKVSFFLNDLYPGENRSVPDPWYGDEDKYVEVFELISNGCDAIIQSFLLRNK